ncbi:hypothetical protein [uncultured Brevundimonas sp.]|uniref:hypothetical protein n=1 Tax=Brevundimonas sp. TaxID=1871086 RepID=UPI0025CE666E|nr:hypothetical protein [uncultured Brevundimonas sp.]
MIGTLLSQLHPYPAMVADELANSIESKYFPDGTTVLDPFCGSGRLLAATAAKDVARVGYDANPLACLLSRAKLTPVDKERVADLVDRFNKRAETNRPSTVISVLSGRVKWFSDAVLEDLSSIVHWINDQELKGAELYLMASALSATARASSFARKSGWKLHRMSETDRTVHSFDVEKYFLRKIRYIHKEISRRPAVCGSTSIINSSMEAALSKTEVKFDRILTSPPYGDSRTTVQYGATSELCLSVVRHIRGLDDMFKPGCVIDRECLGGTTLNADEMPREEIWGGGALNPRSRSVSNFLGDYRQACDLISNSLSENGVAVFVVGCRTVGGHLLRLDRFTTDVMTQNGKVLIEEYDRPLKRKTLPHTINRYARAADDERRLGGAARTMLSEQILVFA